MKLVITDCNHLDIEPERKAAAAAGVELVLADARSADQVIEAAADADALVVQNASVTREVLEALPKVKVVGRYGVGVDTVDVAAATSLGVAVCNVPGYGTESVSDHAISLAVALVRNLVRLDASVRMGSAGIEAAAPIPQFSTLRFGVLGFGRIGRATARKASGVGFEVAVCDIYAELSNPTPEGWPVLGFEELLARSDVLSLHTPLDDSTAHLIDAEALARLPEGAFLINTARGGIVDTKALLEALETGQLCGAGLDVIEDEPLPPDHPLLRAERCILTPHAAFYSEQSYMELKSRTIENVVDVLRGRLPRNILNPEVLA